MRNTQLRNHFPNTHQKWYMFDKVRLTLVGVSQVIGSHCLWL